MSEFPKELKYLATHEWARSDGDRLLVGISDHAQDALGDVVYVELPATGRRVAAGEEVAVVESVKAASDIYAPVAGEVVAVNTALEETPEKVNESPYGDGWFFALRPQRPEDLNGLLDAAAYEALCEGEG